MIENILKFDEFDPRVDEMAKAVPAGSIVKAKGTTDNAENRSGWRGFTPNQFKDVKNGTTEGFYIVHVDKSASKFVEGTVLFTNCLTGDPSVGIKVRFLWSDAIKAGKEYPILEKSKDEIKKMMGTTIYVDGAEPELMTHDGNSIKAINEGEYTCKSTNFELTAKFDEPVVCFVKGDLSFSIKLSDISKMTKQFSHEDKGALADWFSRQLGTEVEFGKDRWSSEKFTVTFWLLTSDSSGGLMNCTFKPFVSQKQAEDFKDYLTKNTPIKLFNDKFKIGSNTETKTLDEMMALCTANGIAAKMKDLVKATLKGASTAKKFGL